jgi:hypothetical protein
MIACFARLDRGHVDDQGAARQGLCRAVIEENFIGHRAVLQHGDDDLRIAHCRSERVMHVGAELGNARGFFARTVPHMDAAARLA